MLECAWSAGSRWFPGWVDWFSAPQLCVLLDSSCGGFCSSPHLAAVRVSEAEYELEPRYNELCYQGSGYSEVQEPLFIVQCWLRNACRRFLLLWYSGNKREVSLYLDNQYIQYALIG